MLDTERIPIGKLKSAFRLNEQDIQTLLSALLPDGVFPTDLWQKAYSSFWRGKILDYMTLYKLDAPSFPIKLACLEFPKIDIPPDSYSYIEKCREMMWVLFVEVSSFLLPDKVKIGIDYILDESYEISNIVCEQERKKLFEKLAIEDNNFAVRFRSCINAEQFIETIDDKIRSVPYEYFSFLSKIFPDTIVVDKVTAILHLFKCGYPLLQEVKGISKAYVERITATPAVHPQFECITEPPVTEPQEDTPVAPFASSIVVTRALWEGKTHSAVIAAMRQDNFPDAIIAYVLHNWCGLKNKTRVGRLLGPPDQDDSTYLRLAHRLLAEAALLNIQHA